jgi:hypothetical protein
MKLRRKCEDVTRHSSGEEIFIECYATSSRKSKSKYKYD